MGMGFASGDGSHIQLCKTTLKNDLSASFSISGYFLDTLSARVTEHLELELYEFGITRNPGARKYNIFELDEDRFKRKLKERMREKPFLVSICRNNGKPRFNVPLLDEKAICTIFPVDPEYHRLTGGVHSLKTKGIAFFDEINNALRYVDKVPYNTMLSAVKEYKKVDYREVRKIADFQRTSAFS